MSNAEIFYKNYWTKLVDILENFEDENFKLSNPTTSNWYQIRFGASNVWIELVSSIKKGEIQAQLRMRYDDNVFEKINDVLKDCGVVVKPNNNPDKPPVTTAKSEKTE